MKTLFLLLIIFSNSIHSKSAFFDHDRIIFDHGGGWVSEKNVQCQDTRLIATRKIKLRNNIIIDDFLPELDNIFSVGMIQGFATDKAPSGWLLCDGSTYQINTTTACQYEKLGAFLGNKWGGDGVTNFKVPDLRGLFIRGASPSNLLGSIQSAGIKSHIHTFTSRTYHYAVINHGTHTHSSFTPSSHGLFSAQHSGIDVDNVGSYQRPGNASNGNTSSVNLDHNHGFSISLSSKETVTDGGLKNETRPKNVAVNYYIKY